MSCTVDLHKGIAKLWVDSQLDNLFKSNWKEGNGEFPTLEADEASAAQPLPYCVLKVENGRTVTRMTKGSSESGRREQREIPVEFHVHACPTSRTNSAKQVAAQLADEVISIFGGHPTDVPMVPEIDNGTVLQVQYQTDHGMKEENDDVYMWVIRYNFLVDVPVAA